MALNNIIFKYPQFKLIFLYFFLDKFLEGDMLYSDRKIKGRTKGNGPLKSHPA